MKALIVSAVLSFAPVFPLLTSPAMVTAAVTAASAAPTELSCWQKLASEPEQWAKYCSDFPSPTPSAVPTP